MRNFVFGSLVVLCALLSCGTGDEDVRQIDQILNIYMKNGAGRDLFHAKKNVSYFTYSLNDVNGAKDLSPVGSTLKATADSTLFIEYIAGAKRVGLDTLDPNNKTYESVIKVSLVKRLNNAILDTINEELKIQYRMTPSVFEVSKVFYNDTLRFTKQPGAANVVTIVK